MEQRYINTRYYKLIYAPKLLRAQGALFLEHFLDFDAFFLNVTWVFGSFNSNMQFGEYRLVPVFAAVVVHCWAHVVPIASPPCEWELFKQ
jgi:hypothetical protein